MKKLFVWGVLALGALTLAAQVDYRGKIVGEATVAIAIPDMRGAGAAAGFAGAFNQTLWGDIQGSGLFKLVPKTMYPLNPPQQPTDLSVPPPPRFVGG